MCMDVGRSRWNGLNEWANTFGNSFSDSSMCACVIKANDWRLTPIVCVVSALFVGNGASDLEVFLFFGLCSGMHSMKDG